MGRVYNALVRADRWKDGDRPIGRPVRGDAQGRGKTAATTYAFSAPSAESVRPSVEDSIPLTEDLLTPSVENPIIPVELAELRAVAAAAALAPRPAAPPARRTVAKSNSPRAQAIEFEEPSEVLNIRDLAINRRLATIIREDHLAVERCRTLAVKLLNLADRRKLKTLLITSAEAGEGKTTIAAGVAWSLAKHPERRVLLIDASPNANSVGSMLAIDPKRGWLNLMDKSCELKHSIVRLDPNGLYVMTTGAFAADEANRAMSSLENVIAELAPRFDLVIVDSPAILESPDAQRLAAVLDGAVIVARAGVTHHRKVTAARKLVPKERRLGLVLNEADADAGIAHRGREKSSLVGRLFGRKR